MTEVDGGLTTAEILYRAIGALGGGFIALLRIWPKSVAEALCRFALSLIAGTIFAPVVLEKIGWPNTVDRNIAAGCLVGAIAWWLFGQVIRLIEAGWIQSIVWRKPG